MPETAHDTPPAGGEPEVRLTVAAQTDIGAHRDENQDGYGLYPEPEAPAPHGRLYIVADGMGGHRGGREASTIAVEVVRDAFARSAGQAMEELLPSAVEGANERILDESDANPHLRGMGTTCSVLAIRGSVGWTAHVGDSRIYRITNEGIEQITDDHSRVAEMVRRGLMTDDEARWHPERSLLYRALGVSHAVEVDVSGPFPILPGENFLLCTDGLVNHVTDDEIRAVTLKNDPTTACALLTDLAIRRGGYDNITIIIVRVEPAD